MIWVYSVGHCIYVEGLQTLKDQMRNKLNQINNKR